MTIYGLVDVGYGTKQIENKAGTMLQKQTGVMDGGYAGNRIGFRGTEDLGRGLNAGFVVEQGISPTNGALFGVRTGTAGMQYDGYAASTGRFDQGTGGGYTQSTNRQTYLSLNSKSMGDLRVGYQYTTLYEISTLSGFTMTSEGVIGGSSAHTHGQAVAGGTRANGITYISPRFSGVQASVQIGSAGGRENTEWAAANSANGLTKDKQKRESFKLDYEAGPLKAAYGYTQFKFDQSARAANALDNVGATLPSGSVSANNAINTFNVYGALTGYDVAAIGAASQYNTKLNQFAASYDFGVAKVGGTWNKGKLKVTSAANPAFYRNTTALSAGLMTATGDYDFESKRVTGVYRLGALSLIAGYGTANVENAGSKVMDLKETQIGVNYNLSKRTIAYAYMGNWKNESQTSATGSHKGTQTIAGVSHSF